MMRMRFIPGPEHADRFMRGSSGVKEFRKRRNTGPPAFPAEGWPGGVGIFGCSVQGESCPSVAPDVEGSDPGKPGSCGSRRRWRGSRAGYGIPAQAAPRRRTAAGVVSCTCAIRQAREHVRQHMGSHPIRGPVEHRTHLQVYRLHAAEGLFHPAQALAETDCGQAVHLLFGQSGADDVPSAECRAFFGDRGFPAILQAGIHPCRCPTRSASSSVPTQGVIDPRPGPLRILQPPLVPAHFRDLRQQPFGGLQKLLYRIVRVLH